MSKYAIKTKPNFILSEEVATEQIVDFLTYYDIDIDKIKSEKNREALITVLDAMTELVRQGTVEFTRDANASMIVVQHIKSASDKLEFREMGAKHKLAMDKFPTDQNYKRMYALMGSLCGLGAEVIEKLPARDLSTTEALATLFINA